MRHQRATVMQLQALQKRRAVADRCRREARAADILRMLSRRFGAAGSGKAGWSSQETAIHRGLKVGFSNHASLLQAEGTETNCRYEHWAWSLQLKIEDPGPNVLQQ